MPAAIDADTFAGHEIRLDQEQYCLGDLLRALQRPGGWLHAAPVQGLGMGAHDGARDRHTRLVSERRPGTEAGR